MLTFAKQTGAVLLTALALVAVTAEPAQAQRRFYSAQDYLPYIQNPYISPGYRLNQYQYNTLAVGRTLQQAYPLNYAYNPYAQAALFSGGNPAYNPSMNPTYNPYYNPAYNYGGSYNQGQNYNSTYGSGYGGGYGGGGYGGYPTDAYYNLSGEANYLNSSANVMKSYGQLGIAQEQARLLEQTVEQAKLDTRKKLVDTRAYELANTPTYIDKLKLTQKQLYDRLLNVPTIGEVWSGKSQNILTEDLKKTLVKAPKIHPIPLNEKLMAKINVTGTGSFGNIGLLRKEGRFEWPVALYDIATSDELKNVPEDTKYVYRLAKDGKSVTMPVEDLRKTVESLRERLLKKANDLPTQQYLEGKRFLNNFDDALTALKSEDLRRNLEFHKEFTGEGRTVQELVDYMNRHGLRFAPAISGDEDAYQALHSLLAAYSIAVNTNVATTTGSHKDY